ncbi:hypothetical protein [Nostoc sp. CALU 546]|uniref:hypothetical protein n=1 Tax=Nostoc sp. CALU 546 TaxID=1867241 RepID=UPI003B677ABD
MGTKSNFHVRIDSRVKKEDLPQLSKEMQTDFEEIFVPLLGEDPYTCKNLFPNHDLEWKLEGWKALEIDLEENGYRECYRLVYKITDTNNIKTVEIISFGLHDPAYDRANERVSARRR